MSTPAPDDRVVVITGASSGLGLATALQFAGDGSTVVLVGRDPDALEAARRRCEAVGGEATVVAADVAEPHDLIRVRSEALHQFGHIDVWVNAAGVASWGLVEDSHFDDFEAVMRTNVLATIFASQIAMKAFRNQQAGILINVASMLGRLPIPYGSAYVASKHAVRGFTLSLRQEAADLDDVHVCLVEPGSIDTPLFGHARNVTGHQLRPNPPTYTAERVAKAVVRLTHHPKAEVQPGALMWLAARLHGLTPTVFNAALGWIVRRTVPKLPEERPSPGNIDRPTAPHEVSGGWRS